MYFLEHDRAIVASCFCKAASRPCTVVIVGGINMRTHYIATFNSSRTAWLVSIHFHRSRCRLAVYIAHTLKCLLVHLHAVLCCRPPIQIVVVDCIDTAMLPMSQAPTLTAAGA